MRHLPKRATPARRTQRDMPDLQCCVQGTVRCHLPRILYCFYHSFHCTCRSVWSSKDLQARIAAKLGESQGETLPGTPSYWSLVKLRGVRLQSEGSVRCLRCVANRVRRRLILFDGQCRCTADDKIASLFQSEDSAAAPCGVDCRLISASSMVALQCSTHLSCRLCLGFVAVVVSPAPVIFVRNPAAAGVFYRKQ